MKAVILAGGLGTRLSEETTLKPKPMVEIGGRPILWHIMKIYSHYGINDFVVCLGYKGYIIKEYFSNYFLHNSDVTFDFTSSSNMVVHNAKAEPWKVTLIDTGDQSMTGGRLKRVGEYLDNDTFCFTYGDGVADVDIGKLVAFHAENGRKATLTAVQPPGRFGALSLDDGQVTAFQEKPVGDGSWINGGFFVLEPDVLDLIDDDLTTWENEPLKALAAAGELSAYKHSGFWQPMDTLRDRSKLEEMWAKANAPWKTWDE
jgi:glucose-1-phosphate cytidylyltransferase